VLVASLLLSLAVPVSRLWQVTTSHLVASVALVPAQPHIGEPVHLVVTLPSEADRAAIHGPWAKLVASWDMAAMSMGAHQVALSGPEPNASSPRSFAVPLTLDMAGQWVAHLSLTTPGRPTWQSSLRFDVLSASPATGSAASGTKALAGGWV
jgi:hypothetical protein